MLYLRPATTPECLTDRLGLSRKKEVTMCQLAADSQAGCSRQSCRRISRPETMPQPTGRYAA